MMTTDRDIVRHSTLAAPMLRKERLDPVLEQPALRSAASAPAVDVEVAKPPASTGNPIEDVRAAAGLTVKDLAQVFDRSERTIRRWRDQGVPRDARSQLAALRAIASRLVGGLGPEGVKRWLHRGEPSPWERIRRGEINAVASEVRGLEDSVAT